MNGLEHLTQGERDELTEHLTEQQKKFIEELLRRGRRTVFANVLAEEKASSSEESTIEEVASQWELLDYIDAGPNWNNNSVYFCDCGRPLRYQYIVQNKETGEIKKFGITHFEMHVGIPPHLVKEIVKGIEKIDFERDEILLKIANNWSLADEQIDIIPAEVEIPEDIQQHFDYDVPLLDRQVRRLQQRITEHYRLRERQRLEQIRMEQEMVEQQKQEVYARQRERIRESLGWIMELDTNQKLYVGIRAYLENIKDRKFLASEVCEELVTYHGAPSARFSSGRLKIFPDVCMILESLVKQGELNFIGKHNGVDRIYQVVGN